jgi:adenylate cyclase
MSDPQILLTLNGTTKRVPVPAGALYIGRGESNGIALPDESAMVSRKHAMIQRDSDNRCFLICNGALNGTHLNGKRIAKPTLLASGDKIEIGEYQMEFQDSTATQVVAAKKQYNKTQLVTKQKLVTVLVIDVLGFTRLSHMIGEQRIAGLMIDFFGLTSTLLANANCWTERNIGDAVMAAWVHDGIIVEGAHFGAIINVIATLVGELPRLTEQHRLPVPLRVGAGINTGLAALGNMGGGSVSDFTVLGDTVNRAFRYESATRTLGCDLVIGAASRGYLLAQSKTMTSRVSRSVQLKGYEDADDVLTFDFTELPMLVSGN